MDAETKSAGIRKGRSIALLGSAIFFLVAPGTVAGLVPWWIGRWRVHAGFPGFMAVRAASVFLMGLGAVILAEAFLRFALKGLGTPAPVYPTSHLVVSGTYRFVRNPMYVAVVSLVLGQGALFGDIRVVLYGMFCWLAMHLFVLLYEEPTLRRSFPAEYAEFCAHVPRWIPRLTPWHERI